MAGMASQLNGKKGGRPKKVRPLPVLEHEDDSTAPPVSPANPHGLTIKQGRFVAAYVGIAAGNATKAYEIAGYKLRGANVRAEASRLLRNPNISQAIQPRREAAERALIMGGDEALRRLTIYGRADIGDVLGPDDPISKLPPDVRAVIKAIRPSRYGRTIELHDAMKATELLAKADGKLKETVKVEHSLEEVMALARTLPAAASG